MSNILEIDDVSKNFGGLRAISNLSFGLGRQEILGLIGPNGAGKTTLFNLISGFLRPTNGGIKFKGEAIHGLKPHKIVKKGITKTFQIPKPFHSLTLFENVIVSLLPNLRSPGEIQAIKEKAQEIIEVVGLKEKKEMFPETLTQGNLKQLEIARALATSPELLLLDEPFAGLTLDEIAHLTSLIQALHQKNISIIIVEHKLRELMKIVQRVIVLDFGQKIADGSPEEIVRHEKVVEAYLGSGGYSLEST